MISFVTYSKDILQISFPPFFYEVFLYDLIDDDQSRIIVQNGFVEVTLTKQNLRKWNQLSHIQSGYSYFVFIDLRNVYLYLDDKEAMKNLREEALNQIALKQKQRNEATSSLLNTNKREAVREQMKV